MPKSKILMIRVTPEQHKDFKAQAKASGEPLSGWARGVLANSVTISNLQKELGILPEQTSGARLMALWNSGTIVGDAQPPPSCQNATKGVESA